MTMINMAIIGFGSMGEVHAGWINRSKDLKLVAVSKKVENRVDEIKNKFGVEVYLDNHKLLVRSDIDYVVIAATNEVHEELTIEAFKNGKNVIVEKPMSTSYESTLRMIDAAKQYQKKLFVYHSQRWDKDFLFVKETIESGVLGDILLIEANTLEYGERWAHGGIHGIENPWRIKAEYGGGILFDWGPHLVDHILQIMKKDPIEIYGVLQNRIWSSEVEDFFFACLEFENKTICHIRAFSNCYIPPPRWFIVGTLGTLLVKGSLDSLWDEAEMIYVKSDGEKDIKRIKMKDHSGAGSSSGFYDNFVKYVKGDISEFVDMYDGSKVIKVLEIIKESSIENKSISF